jgi:hypothetical protein
VDDGVSEVCARDLLPGSKIRDSLIFAAAAVLDCGLLVTSDERLRGVDHELLTLVLTPLNQCLA